MLDENERKVTGTDGIEGLVLRYGFFYGPGTYYASDGALYQQVAARRFPVIGGGRGTTSYVHIADAAAATVAARGARRARDLQRRRRRAGAAARVAARARRGDRRQEAVPAAGLDRAAARRALRGRRATTLRGASNAKAKRELGWTPRVPSWREGFKRYLDTDPA